MKEKSANHWVEVIEARKRHNDGLTPIVNPEGENFLQDLLGARNLVRLFEDKVKIDIDYYNTLSPEAKDVYEKKVRFRHNLAMDLGLMIEQIKTEGVSSSESTSEDKELLQKLEEVKKLIEEYH